MHHNMKNIPIPIIHPFAGGYREEWYPNMEQGQQFNKIVMKTQQQQTEGAENQ